LDAYGAAKARLFEREGVRRVVLNANDPFAGRLAERLARGVSPIRVGVIGDDRARRRGLGTSRRSNVAAVTHEQANSEGDPDVDGGDVLDIAARVRSHGLGGLELELSGRFGSGRLRSPLIGTFNAENLLVALGTLIAWDFSLADACAALSGCTAPPGRLEVVGASAPRTPSIVVDYAHTPDGLDRVLETVSALADGELWCVFGCGGERDPGKRAPMGAIAAEWADHIVVTDDNPRGEDSDAIVREILEGVGAHPSTVVEHDRAAAIRRAIRGARAGDVVLIAGKGHETTQRIGAQERPFSDRDVARAALDELAVPDEPTAPGERG
jgi:UDP-N-acetylmuramoyl-L-alanyl-D-glutamate--2,6-diaminopimelate ligase